MMQERTACACILLCLLAPGCFSRDSPGVVAPANGDAIDQDVPPKIIPLAHEGRTGARGCILTPATLNCPYATRGTEDPIFACGERNATRLQANLTWDASGLPPPEFHTSIFHRPSGSDEWRPEPDWGARTTKSPILIDLDLTPFPGEEFSVHVTAWRVVGNDMAGVLVSQGESFMLDGALSCAS